MDVITGTAAAPVYNLAGGPFASNQHPSAGYAMRLGTDAPGTLRDPFIYKVGDDYYHKTFSTTTEPPSTVPK